MSVKRIKVFGYQAPMKATDKGSGTTANANNPGSGKNQQR
jgi:hypothetical protein